MDISINNSSNQLISFNLIKVILEHFDLNQNSLPNELVKYVYFLFPLDKKVREKFLNLNISLTDSINPDERIRFRGVEILERNYIAIIKYLNNLCSEEINLKIYNSSNIDELSLNFLELASSIGKWNINFYLNDDKNASSYELTDEEKDLCKLLSTIKYTENPNKELCLEAIKIGKKYLNVSDAITALNIGKILKEKFSNYSPVWSLLSTSELIRNNAIKSEYYSHLWIEKDEDPLKLYSVGAMYSQAMLYAKVHEKEIISLEKSLSLLEKGYSYLNNLKPEEVIGREEEITFEKIFNRNGYALLLFQSGKIDESISLMKWGIGLLDEFKNKTQKVLMHQSVLIYNLAQCYEKIGNFKDAIKVLDRLIDIDPYMPEYILFLSEIYAKLGDMDKAMSLCEEAIELNPFNYQNWSIKGFYYNKMEDYKSAGDSFLKAANLIGSRNPLRHKYINELIYNMLLDGDENFQYMENSILPYLNVVNNNLTMEYDEIERSFILLAEICVRNNDIDKAKEILDNGLEVLSNNESLKENLKIVLDQQNLT